jgi:hypothetical protein
MKNQNQREEVKFAFSLEADGSVSPKLVVRNTNVVAEIPARVYRLEVSEESGVRLVPENDFKMPAKIYGKVNNHAQRILRSYELNSKNLGVLLIGDAGSGKTLTLKQVAMLAVELQYPVILIDEAVHGNILAQFLATITQPCVVCIDEFDKKYGGRDKDGDAVPGMKQDAILELLDGANSAHKKIFILTANNDDAISVYLKDRPSRIRYTLPYKRIEQDTVIDYVGSELKNCTEEDIRAFLLLTMADSDGFRGLNFDSMAELVNEMNQFQCPLDEALEFMIRQGKVCRSSFEVTVFHNGQKIHTAGAHGRHNGVYLHTGDYEIKFIVTVPSADRPGCADRVAVTLTKDHYVGSGENYLMSEFKYGDFTFMLQLVNYAKASHAASISDKEYKERPEVKAHAEAKAKERKERPDGGGNNDMHPLRIMFHGNNDADFPETMEMQALLSSKHFGGRTGTNG